MTCAVVLQEAETILTASVSEPDPSARRSGSLMLAVRIESRYGGSRC
jgi:hypothetical protein